MWLSPSSTIVWSFKCFVYISDLFFRWYIVLNLFKIFRCILDNLKIKYSYIYSVFILYYVYLDCFFVDSDEATLKKSTAHQIVLIKDPEPQLKTAPSRLVSLCYEWWSDLKAAWDIFPTFRIIARPDCDVPGTSHMFPICRQNGMFQTQSQLKCTTILIWEHLPLNYSSALESATIEIQKGFNGDNQTW